MKLLNKLKDKVKSMLPKKDSLSVAGINIPIIPFNLNRPKHKTIPAPQVLKDDEWFGPAIISDSNKDYMEREAEAFKADALNYYSSSKESEDIHQKMYEIATKSATTLKLDPPGGSENYHEGPGRWNSGQGMLNRD